MPAAELSLDVSVVLPCYNEQDHVLLEVERISEALDASGLDYELIVIDDKSTDGTLALLEQAQEKYPRDASAALPAERWFGNRSAYRDPGGAGSGDGLD